MKRKIAGLVFVLFVSLSGIASGDSAVSVKTSQELRDALERGISDIIITASVRGNFIIPRGVNSISGTGRNITVTPSDLKKPVFDVEGSFFLQNSGGLKISRITIISPGTHGAVDANASPRPLTLSGVRVIGYRGNRNSAVGCRPGTVTHITGCTFENLSAGIYAANPGSAYDIKIDSCIFRNVSQALTMEKTNPNAKASITKCRGDNVGWWASQHAPDDFMTVNVDQATIDSYGNSDYYTGVSTRHYSRQLKDYRDNLEAKFRELHYDARDLIIREARRGWDGIRIYASMGLARKMKEVDFSPENIHVIDECLDLYALLASAPLAGIFSDDGKIDSSKLLMLYADTIRGMAADKNLIMPVIRGFMSNEDLGPLTRTGGKIYWGNSGNVRKALGRISQNPDGIFRENLHKFRDWLTALDDARRKLSEIGIRAGTHYDYDYVLSLEKRLRVIHDFGIADGRMARAVFFDLPMNLSFAVNYARVSEETDKARIIDICRELGSFYGISQQLCTLSRTQTLRNELINLWKNSLTEFVLWPVPGKDTSKYDELLALLRVDNDIMRDADNVSRFFKEWQ